MADEAKLELGHEEKTSKGEQSNFHKLVKCEESRKARDGSPAGEPNAGVGDDRCRRRRMELLRSSGRRFPRPGLSNGPDA